MNTILTLILVFTALFGGIRLARSMPRRMPCRPRPSTRSRP